jgi:hypothetical protein
VPHDIAFVDSVVQAPVRVLGLNLRAFSLGHEIILIRQRNPIVSLTSQQFSELPQEQQAAAIQNAALVCYRSWEENQRPEKWVWLWLWKIRKLDHGKALSDFLSYRYDGSSFPPAPSEAARTVTKSDREEARLLGSPFLCRLYSFISQLPDREIRAFGTSAFDFPLGFASFIYMSHLEMEGSAQVENAKEAQIEAEWKKHLEDIPKERRLA